MDKIQIITYLSYLSSASILVPLIVSLIKYRTFSTTLKVLSLYIVISFVIETISLILVKNDMYNLFLSHILTFLEFSIFTFIFFDLLNIRKRKLLLTAILSAFLIICLVDVMFISGYMKMNELSRNVECFSLITFAIFYFKTFIQQTEYQNPLKLFSFWFSTASIIYFSGSFFLFIFSNSILDTSPATFLALFTIHSLFNITFNTLLAISFTKKTNVA